MDYEKFLEIAEEFLADSYDIGKIKRSDRLTDDEKKMFVHMEEIGGAIGGNCYGDNARRYTTNNEEDSEFESLINFLTQKFPRLNFLVFRNIMKEVETTTVYESEYYGNYTEYEASYITVRKLYKIMFREQK